ncbi:MAG: hypothetical protein BGO78_01355 [Chloroflexi bacterium 44-23]|nr:MAG: hypothetical protein BGO78_01355 [Chloroflexi bacterium 44-23]
MLSKMHRYFPQDLESNSKKIRYFFAVFQVFFFLITSCYPPNFSRTVNSTNQTPQTHSSTVIIDEVAYQKVLSKKYIRISSIQGAAHISPYNHKDVSNVFGVVTVKRADGFYIQSVEADGDDKTSEGIFVFSISPPNIKVGDWVLVSGRVVEHYPGGLGTDNLSITEIENPTVSVISSGNDLPDPIIIGEQGRQPPTEIIDDDRKKQFDLVDGLDYYESLESMLVQVNDAVCVGPTTIFNEFVVIADSGKFASGINSRGGITISESDFNPERIIIDDSLAPLPIVKVGDRFPEPIVGIMDYSFGNFKLLPLKKMAVDYQNLPPSVTTPPKSNQLAIATFNVENLSAVDSDHRFERLAEIIVVSLNAPDIIALQEVQDNNGLLDDNETSAGLTFKKISDFVIKAGGPAYNYIEIEPERNKDGGQPGGNIRVGFLYRTDRGLEIIRRPSRNKNEAAKFELIEGEMHLTANPARVDPLNYVFVNSRKPLIAEFMYNEKTFFIINSHWNSKSGDTPLFGNVQPAILNSENQRKGQAKAVAELVRQALEYDSGANIIVLGDLNDFYFSAPSKELSKIGMISFLINLPIYDRYTYNYEGNSQNLDNVFITPHINTWEPQIEIAHVNSEYAYRESFSDHDPIYILLKFE